ncbi:thiamine diphosphokinase [Streptococcus sp. DD12]|uniref:thiamine diphosphokinase n=1 Tax=Streptococcus sp. DD12 TaxID=1777880 RepID=UPI00079439D5|nr:thiamine diphosphokinase [Streptococcus sp. DD12]KXT75280.1 Thiamin pyrophosphokinase [Streptococcus sp. DD12]
MAEPSRLYVSGDWDLQDFQAGQLTLACDWAAYRLLAAGHRVDVAVGDFDSVTPEEFETIQAQVETLVVLPTAKDDTDAQAAVLWFFEHYPQGELEVIGAFGGRLDHALANIFLPSHPAIAPFMRQIFLRDREHVLRFYPPGDHLIQQTPGMTGLAFIQEGALPIDIRGALFELTRDRYFSRKIYSSNQFIGKKVALTVRDGYVICMETRERKKEW